jgi:hypothetical protein
MVYDEKGNFIGDTHWREDYTFDEGEELQLERAGYIIEVSECVGRRDQDLTELLEKHSKDKDGLGTPTPSHRAPLAPKNWSKDDGNLVLTSAMTPLRKDLPAVPNDRLPYPHRINAFSPVRTPPHNGTFQGHALKQSDTPEERPAKRRKEEDSFLSKKGYAQNLTGATLTLTGGSQGTQRVRHTSLVPRLLKVAAESQEAPLDLTTDTAPASTGPSAADRLSLQPGPVRVTGRSREKSTYANSLLGTPLVLNCTIKPSKGGNTTRKEERLQSSPAKEAPAEDDFIDIETYAAPDGDSVPPAPTVVTCTMKTSTMIAHSPKALPKKARALTAAKLDKSTAETSTMNTSTMVDVSSDDEPLLPAKRVPSAQQRSTAAAKKSRKEEKKSQRREMRARTDDDDPPTNPLRIKSRPKSKLFMLATPAALHSSSLDGHGSEEDAFSPLERSSEGHAAKAEVNGSDGEGSYPNRAAESERQISQSPECQVPGSPIPPTNPNNFTISPISKSPAGHVVRHIEHVTDAIPDVRSAESHVDSSPSRHASGADKTSLPRVVAVENSSFIQTTTTSDTRDADTSVGSKNPVKLESSPQADNGLLAEIPHTSENNQNLIETTTSFVAAVLQPSASHAVPPPKLHIRSAGATLKSLIAQSNQSHNMANFLAPPTRLSDVPQNNNNHDNNNNNNNGTSKPIPPAVNKSMPPPPPPMPRPTSPADLGPWSREAFDLFGFSRPSIATGPEG